MTRRLARNRPKREPTIALINIVFLMLVFFMVAGTLSQPLDPSLTLVKTKELDGRAPPDALVMHSDGSLSYRGQPLPDIETFFDGLDADSRETIRIVPDQDAPATDLVNISRTLRAAGAERILIVSERGL
ncbi:MAG: biopolymer transporter ExbD [Pseudomonadota bacterium]